MKQTARPPGPPQRWLTGSFAEFRRDLLGFMRDSARDYGDVVSFRLGRKPCLLVSHPDLIEQVLVKQNRNFVKPFAYQLTRPVLGNGLLTSEGDFWLRQRRLAAPAFRADRIASYGADMVTSTTRLLEDFRDGQPRDIHNDMMHLTLDIVARTLFGADVTEASTDIGDALLSAMRGFAANFTRTLPLPAWIPTRSNRRVRAAVRGLNEVVQKIIDQRRSESQTHHDLLSMMLHARDEDGTQMTDAQLADEARTFLLAGHETTAITLSWSWYLLASHPEIQTQLHAELDRVVGDRLPTVADMEQLKLTEQIVLEAMRVYPPVFMIGRGAVQDFDLGEYRIPAGTTIFMSQWVTHRDGRFFPRPEQFEPQRWTEEFTKNLPKMAYFPFGGGPRICIGNTFAMMESVLLLATIASRWSFQLVPDQTIRLAPLLTLRPRYGVQVIPTRRTPGPSAAPAVHAAAPSRPVPLP